MHILKAYQYDGSHRLLQYLKQRNVAYLFDEPGLGKTAQAIEVSKNYVGRVLVVCPATLKHNWLRELIMWGVDELDVSVLPDVKIINSKYVIVNYDQLRKFSAALASMAWELIIIDEAHYVKNEKAQRTRTLIEIIQKSQAKVLAMTGTPVSNRPKDLIDLRANLENWTNKERWHDYFFFCGAKKVKIGRKEVWDISGAQNLDIFNRERIINISVRRTKKHVLTELHGVQRTLIELDNKNGKIAEREYRELMQAIDAVGFDEAIRQLPNGFSNDDGGSFAARRQAVALEKLPDCINFIDDLLAAEQKIVVFAWHKAVIAKLREHYGEICVVLDGSTPQKERESAIVEFQLGAKAKVFIGNIKAAGIGITLTAASHVVFVETTFVPSDIEQAESRLDRLGQTQLVNSYFLVQKKSIDSVILKKVLKKERTIAQIFSQSER